MVLSTFGIEQIQRGRIMFYCAEAAPCPPAPGLSGTTMLLTFKHSGGAYLH